MMKTVWDYSDLARHYDKRVDYSDIAIDQLLALVRPDPAIPIADLGAGTGKLTKMFLAHGYEVRAVEPNDEMRSFGIRNTAGEKVVWSEGTGEASGLPGGRFDLVSFGSSFNVTDRERALMESARILRPGGWFACMWNHRDLEDPLQADVERLIHERVVGYSYGTRREDQTAVIRDSGLFEEPVVIEGRTGQVLSVSEYVEAWRSHATLQRQAGEAFGDVVDAIAEALAGRDVITVPYTTRIWCARLDA